jgi:hypothetical protein
MEVTNEIRDTFQNYPPRQHRKDLSYIKPEKAPSGAFSD